MDLAIAFNAAFRFGIGDLVRMKSYRPAHPKEFRFNPEKDGVFIILERVAQQCHSGMQLSYVCRATAETGHVVDPPLRLFEVELVPYEPITPKVNDA